VQTQVPAWHAHVGPGSQVPQDPPQLSSPQFLPVHWGAHLHRPLTHCWPVGQSGPQVPLQPSVPQTLLVQSATQGQVRGYVPVGSASWEGPQVYWVLDAVQ